MADGQKRAFVFPKLRRIDIIALVLLAILLVVAAIPIYSPKNGCEVARPAYKCLPAKTVMAEHCQYWGNFSCNTEADVSLPQVEWYIGNLCNVHNNLHPDDRLDCSNLKAACDRVVGKNTCGIGLAG